MILPPHGGGRDQMKTDVMIVGGGLAGLALADHLERAGRDYLLFEAGARFGGRIKTLRCHGGAFDLGPAWFWPGQPRMQGLIKRFGIETFEQFSDGLGLFEDRHGTLHPTDTHGSMRGSLRIKGGCKSLIDALRSGLESDRLHLACAVTALSEDRGQLSARVMQQGDALEVSARHVVFAVPPRLVSQNITFSPTLSEMQVQALRDVPTWMAGHAKIVAVYDRPHWRDAGFSGDAISQKGPLSESHDASAGPQGPFAIFGFVGLPAAIRQNHRMEILDLARAQLSGLFGQEMSNPSAIHMEDWSANPLTATQADHVAPQGHPAYGMPPALRGLFEGKVIFASSEMGRQFGGFLEGALEAAEAAALWVQNRRDN